DLFEYWIGDDDTSPTHAEVIASLAALSGSGVPLFVMRGNRDFLLGRRFERMSGAHLLDDPTRIELYGRPTLLMHGDSLCTQDLAYQRYKRRVRNPLVTGLFLAMPHSARRRIVEWLRRGSRDAMRHKPEAIMDVDPGAVAQCFDTHDVAQIVHGHTHRPGVHDLHCAGRNVQRIVLGDWYETDSVLVCSGGQQRLSRVQDCLR
ncbi:MAG: UDP-2,3-diacylglucosamine diphosphatase, partial [Gammaproteobacteria bacterium]